MSSDGGLIALREADKKLGLIAALDAVMEDPREADQVVHRQRDLLSQRIYGLALGYEDLNDTLRKDLLWQSAVERGDELASSPKMYHLEQRADRQTAWAMSKVLVEMFIQSFKQAPQELILDFDATDDRVHGQQEGRDFHGYYGDWCFLPLYVFCGEQLSACVDHFEVVGHAPAPGVAAGEDHLPRRLGLLSLAHAAVVREERSGLRGGLGQEPAVAGSVGRSDGVGGGLFRGDQGKATALCALGVCGQELGSPVHSHRQSRAHGQAQKIYDEIYCVCGEMENLIKEQQLELFADRTSCHGLWANQFRLLLSSAAYVLMEYIRRTALAGTELACAQVTTIRLKLLKIGAVILRKTRRIRLLFSSAYPHQQLFATMLGHLNSA